MSNFESFYKLRLSEAKVRIIPKWIEDTAKRIVQKYKNFANPITPLDLKDLKKTGIDQSWVEYYQNDREKVWFVADLTTALLIDSKTNKQSKYEVVVAFGNNSGANKSDTIAMCDTSGKLITIFYDNAQPLSEEKLISSIVHEIIHSFQQHKTYSKKYLRLLKSNDKSKQVSADMAYHKEPIEFDAYTAEIAHLVRQHWNNLKSNIDKAARPETKKIMESRLEKFLLELKLFVTSPLETYLYYKELPLPKPLETFEEFLTNIQTSRTRWNSFKLKMQNLYEELAASNKS